MRAVIYVRISEDKTGEELGVDRQRQACLELAARRGWTVVEVFVENDTSAAAGKKRPEWERMMRLVEDGGADVIIGWVLDRILRSGRDRLRVLEVGKKLGLTIAPVRGSDLDLGTPTGRLTADILGAVAQGEIEFKSDRQKAANEQAAKRGRRLGGRRPFGYEQDGMTIRETEADAIRAAYAAFLTGGTLTGIARAWNEAGLLSAQAADRDGVTVRWRSTTVAGVLRNPRYAALRGYRPNGSKTREIVGPASWPAIVHEDTWRAVQAILDDPSRRQVRGGWRLLTNIATCGVPGCGLPVHGGGAGHGKPVYRCQSMRHFNRLAGPVDDWVGEVVVARLSRADAAELLVDDNRPDVDALREQAQVIRTRLAALTREFADNDDMPVAEWRAIRARMTDRLVSLERQMADAGKVDLLGPLISAPDVRVAWFGAEDDDGDEGIAIDRKRAVVDALMEVRLLPVGRGRRGFRSETVEISLRSE